MLQCITQGSASRHELLRLHSPLLEESNVVFFPPLTYMLKFRGYLQQDRMICQKRPIVENRIWCPQRQLEHAQGKHAFRQTGDG